MPPMFRLIWFAMLDFRILVRAVRPVWSRNLFQTSRNSGSVNVLIFVYYEMRIPDHIFWSILYISYVIQGQPPTIQVAHIQPPIGRTYDAQHRVEYSRVDPCGQPGTGGARATCGQTGPLRSTWDGWGAGHNRYQTPPIPGCPYPTTHRPRIRCAASQRV